MQLASNFKLDHQHPRPQWSSSSTLWTCMLSHARWFLSASVFIPLWFTP